MTWQAWIFLYVTGVFFIVSVLSEIHRHLNRKRYEEKIEILEESLRFARLRK